VPNHMDNGSRAPHIFDLDSGWSVVNFGPLFPIKGQSQIPTGYESASALKEVLRTGNRVPTGN
jgi:hypothetical protein